MAAKTSELSDPGSVKNSTRRCSVSLVKWPLHNQLGGANKWKTESFPPFDKRESCLHTPKKGQKFIYLKWKVIYRQWLNP